MEKNPLVAAVLNFITGGLGYIYLGKRVVFGGLIFLGILLSFVWFLSFPASRLVVDNFWIIASTLVFMIALAYDGYQEASK